MARLQPKQEKFCQLYIELGNASEAYRQAYNASKMKPETIKRKAQELLENGTITATYIAELKAEHKERHNTNVDDLIAELEEARKMALDLNIQEKPQVSAAVTATMGKAKLLGLDKVVLEHTGKDGKDLEVVITRRVID